MDHTIKSLPISTALAVLSMVLAGVVSYFTATATMAASISAVDTKVQVVQAKAEDENARLDRIENKVDKLLIKSGINPTTVGPGS